MTRGLIVPNKLLKLDYGRRLREWLVEQRLLEEIVDFGDAQVFAGATNYTCILVLTTEGQDHFEYRRLRGDPAAVSSALATGSIPSEPYLVAGFGGDPWILAAGEEARLLKSVAAKAERLDDVTEQIFQGLITSADPVYIFEDRGTRGDLRRVYSRAAGAELELEPDLLHPLASGRDVDRYAFHPLSNLLLFPYIRDAGQMRLLTSEELGHFPRSQRYLRRYEPLLRARERGAMDHDRWYAFGRTQSLSAHDRPKLGVAATVRRLEVAADPDGAVYFHNVRVNGILIREGGIGGWSLLSILNSRLLDFVFRRGAAEHAGGHYAANKQFIAPLPIRLPDASQAVAFEQLGGRLHETASAIGAERAGFLSWLEGTIGARLGELSGSSTLSAYDRHELDALLAVLRANRSRLARDPDTRGFREVVERELSSSLDRLAQLRGELAGAEAEADEAVYDLYGLSRSHRAMVVAEYQEVIGA